RPPLQLTLDEKINAALGNSTMAIDDLQQLLGEIETGIREGAKQVRQEHDRSLDPSTSPVDRDQAAQRSASADLECLRLARALVTLRARRAEILQRERWSARFERQSAACAALAKEFADSYRSIAKQLVELLQRIESCDRESAAINSDASELDGEHRRLPKVELIARQLEGFSSKTPSIIQNVTLPDWTGNSAFWPLPQPSMASAFAAVAPPHHPHRFSANWWKDNERRAAAQRAEQQRIADYYARTTQEQEDRENAEARERFLELQQRLSVNRPLMSPQSG